jgi:aryl-alcohol dehydrogenase-like predicted oxidoreductase
MQTRAFGKTGIQLSAIGFGVVPLTLDKRPTEADAIRVIHEALDGGVSWLDTADAYCRDAAEVGYGERLVARAVREWRDGGREVRVATKGGHVRFGATWEVDGRPEHLRAACEASLRALNVSSIFLYQLHRPDPRVYFPDSVGALADLQREGKIQHIGLSNVEMPHLRSALEIASVAAVQNCTSVVDRGYFTTGVVAACEELGIAYIAHSPLGGANSHARIGAHPVLQSIAQKRSLNPYQIALAWLLAQSPNIFPIPGSRNPKHVREFVAAADVTLEDGDRIGLGQAFPPRREFVQKALKARREVGYLLRNGRALLKKTAKKAVRGG